jgi:hypothetical protein
MCFNTQTFWRNKKEYHLICDHIDKIRGHYVKWNKPGTKGEIITRSHSYVDSKNFGPIDVEWSLSEVKVVGGRQFGLERCLTNNRYYN